MIYNVCNCKYHTIYISVIRVLIFMFRLRYIGHTVYRLSTHTSAAAQKLITFLDVRSAMFCSNAMENNCKFEM